MYTRNVARSFFNGFAIRALFGGPRPPTLDMPTHICPWAKTSFVEKEADPCQGEALRLVDGQRIGEADGELGAFLGERTALDRASVQRDEDFPRAGSTLTE